MAETDQVKFVVDFDTSEGLKKILNLKGTVTELGDAKNVEGLIAGLLEVGAIAATLGAVFYGTKTVMEAVFEAESIKAVNAQFEVLARNAGVAANVLREELVGAAGGLADDTDILQAASRALATMSGNAEKIPQVMGLARKMTAAFGGDLIQNFEAMNLAIASGNMRTLRHMGIIVDATKAQRDFAIVHKISSDAMTQTAKQQALLNAVLEKGNEASAGVDPNIKQATNAWKQFKVVLTEIAETMALVTDKIAGNATRAALTGLAKWFKELNIAMVDNFGTGADKAAAHLENTKVHIENSRKELALLTAQYDRVKGHDPFVEADTANAIKRTQAALFNYRTELLHAESAAKAAAGRSPTGAAKTGEPLEDTGKAAEIAAKQHDELIALEMRTLKAREAVATEWSQFQSLKEQEITLLHQKNVVELEKLDAQVKTGKIVDAEEIALRRTAISAESTAEIAQIEFELKQKQIQAAQELVDESLRTVQAKIEVESSIDALQSEHLQRRALLEQQYSFQLEEVENQKLLSYEQKEAQKTAILESHTAARAALDEKEKNDIKKADDNLLKSREISTKAFSVGWTSAATAAKNVNQSFASVSGKAFTSVGDAASEQFIAMAKGAKFSADAMMKAILGAIGTEAIQRGVMLTLSSIWPPNPVGMAAGIALIGFGGGLVGASGGGGAATPSSGGAGGSVAPERSASEYSTDSGATASAEQNQRQQRTVNVQVAGNYFETEQTRRQLMEMIRSETDATDFRYARIGEA